MAITALSNFLVTLEKAFSGAWSWAFGGSVRGRAAGLALDSALSNYAVINLGAPVTNPNAATITATNVSGMLNAAGNQYGYAIHASNQAPLVGGNNAGGISSTVRYGRTNSGLTLVGDNGLSGLVTLFDFRGDGTLVMGGTAFPTTPVSGDIYFRTDVGIVYRYDGTSWVSLMPHALVQGTVDQTLLGTGATKLTHGTLTDNVGGFSLNTSVLTVPGPGRYEVAFNGTFTAFTAATGALFKTYISNSAGAFAYAVDYQNSPTVTTGFATAGMTAIVDLSADLTLGVYASVSTGTYTFSAGTTFNSRFSVKRLQ